MNQALFGVAAIGDVARDTQRARRRRLLVAERHGVNLEPAPLASGDSDTWSSMISVEPD